MVRLSFWTVGFYVEMVILTDEPEARLPLDLDLGESPYPVTKKMMKRTRKVKKSRQNMVTVCSLHHATTMFCHFYFQSSKTPKKIKFLSLNFQPSFLFKALNNSNPINKIKMELITEK